MNLKIFDLLSMRFVLKIIFFFAFSINFITPAVFATFNACVLPYVPSPKIYVIKAFAIYRPIYTQKIYEDLPDL